MNRRLFIRKSIAGAAIIGTIPVRIYGKSSVQKHPHDRIILGNTGIETSRMAIGTGTNGWNGSSNQTRKLGVNGLSDLIKLAYDEGITFWDSADMYGSHAHLNEALKSVPRDKVTILTKTTSRTAKDIRTDLDRFRKEIGTDYLDIVLLHAETNGNWNNKFRESMDALSEAREKGIIRAHGISCHSIEALKTAAKEPWVQVDLARFNPVAVSMDADVKTVTSVLQEMKNNGKAIITMKVYGAGRLTDRKDECLKFQFAHDFVDGFTLGIENVEQLHDIQQRMPANS